MLAQAITTFCNDLGVDPASLNDGGGVHVCMCACVHLGSRHRRAFAPCYIFAPPCHLHPAGLALPYFLKPYIVFP